jgi:hypothetical protein
MCGSIDARLEWLGGGRVAEEIFFVDSRGGLNLIAGFGID